MFVGQTLATGGGGGHLYVKTFIRQNFASARSFKDGISDSLV